MQCFMASPDCPQVDHQSVYILRSLRWPLVAHVEVVRDNARPRLQLALQLRNQLKVEPWQQEERHDRRLADVGLEEILVHESDAIADAGLGEVVHGFTDQPR